MHGRRWPDGGILHRREASESVDPYFRRGAGTGQRHVSIVHQGRARENPGPRYNRRWPAFRYSGRAHLSDPAASCRADDPRLGRRDSRDREVYVAAPQDSGGTERRSRGCDGVFQEAASRTEARRRDRVGRQYRFRNAGGVMNLFMLLLFFAAPFWQAKAPADWDEEELAQMFTNSPWAQALVGPSNAPPLSAYFATADPMAKAELERDRRHKLKRPDAAPDLLAEEYRAWYAENHATQIVVAIPIPRTRAFDDAEETRHMEIGR